MKDLSSEAKNLKVHLTKGKIRPFVVIVPLDTGILTEVETVLRAHLSKNAPKVKVSRFSVNVGAGKQALTRQVEEITNTIRQEAMEIGLFGEANLFVIQNFPGNCCVAQVKLLSAVVGDTNAVILGLDQARGAKSMLTLVNKSGFVLSVKNIARYKAVTLVNEAARDLHVTLTQDAVNTIVDLIGTDRGYIYSAVQSLADAYGHERSISSEDCAAMVSRRVKVMPWDLTDAFGRRDLAGTIKFMNLLLNKNGHDALRIFSTIMNHVRKLMAAQAFLMEPDPAGALASRLKMSPYPARKLIEHTRNFTAVELSDFLSRTPDMEAMLKASSASGAVPALTLFISRIVVKSRR